MTGVRVFNRQVSQESSLALQHALMSAARDMTHRPKALSALRGAELWAATFPLDPASLRSLTYSSGLKVLPVFSSPRQLEDAAARYGWVGPDGEVPTLRVAMSEAIRHAKAMRAKMLVVDVAADHAIDLDEGELELLSTSSGRSPSYEALSVISRSRPPEAGRTVKRVSTRPPPAAREGTTLQPVDELPSALKPSLVTPDPDSQVISATFGAASTATMSALADAASEDLLDSFTALLREYPEVEWACVVEADRGHGRPSPSVALRIEPAFRRHLAEISEKLQAAAAEYGQPYEVLVIDTPDQVRQARTMGQPFYPWRKETTRKR
jgi:hypothetical protein